MSEHEARRVVYGRSQGVCEVCGNRPGQSFHHRKNRSQGGDWTPANGLHTCGDGTRGCHGYITRNPAHARLNGWSVRGSGDPAGTPVIYRGRPVLLDDDGAMSEVEEVSSGDHG